jgi:hypothetical protein
MKIIYVGSLAKRPDRDTQWVEAFSKLGLEVYTFGTQIYFFNSISFFDRILRRLNIGNRVNQINKDFLEFVNEINPTWVHFRMPVEFSSHTLKYLKKKGIFLTSYFNDDPYSRNRIKFYYRLFKTNIKYFDIHFVYRIKNIQEFFNAGAKKVIHCPPAFVPWRHNKINIMNGYDILCDGVFIGHWENDNRVSYLEFLVDNNISIKIFGGMWPNFLKRTSLKNMLPIIGIFDQDYNITYASALCGLCFFSKINNDQWTERPLEIIAVGGLLVCERTPEAISLFKDREEAFFFSSKEELLSIILELKNNKTLRNKVLSAGYNKLMSSNHSILDRAQFIYNCFLNR